MRLAAVAALVMTLALAGCTSPKTAFSEPEAKVAITQVLQRQVAAYATNNPRTFYETYSPQARKSCPYESFLPNFTRYKALIGNETPTLSNVSFIFNGTITHAEVSFNMNFGNINRATSGNMIVVAGKWYEDDSPC